MAGPWEKYQTAPAAPAKGPWEKYGEPEIGPAPWYERAIPAFIEKPFESVVNIREQLAGTVPEWMGGAAEREKAASMREDLRSVQAAAGPEGPFRTGMNIAGQVAEFAGPAAGGVALGRQALQRLPQALARRRSAQIAAPLAGEVVTAGGYEAARTQGTLAEKAQAAALAAAGTLAGAGVGAGLVKAVQGVRRSRRGQALLDEGIRLTPAQAGAGRMVSAAEEGLSNVVGWGGINRLREQAVQDWSGRVLRDIAPGVTETGHVGIKQAQRILGKALDDVTEEMAEIRPGIIRLTGKKVEELLPSQLVPFDDVTRQRISRGILHEIDNLRRRPSAEAWQAFNSRMRDMASKYRTGGDIREAEVIERARDAVLDLQPPAVRDRLNDLNRRYRNLVVVQEAAQYQPALEAGGVFGPVELLKAARKQGSSRMTAAGEATMQGTAREALALQPNVATRRRSFMGEQLGPNILMGGTGYALGGPVGAATMGAAGVPLASDVVRRALLGQLPGVQSNRAKLIAEALRNRSGPVGAALTVERE